MEIIAQRAYDLKYLSSKDINYNPSLGTGQIQIRDIHYIELKKRTTWDFCKLLDQKYLQSSKRSYNQWLELAHRHEWVKFDE